MKDKTKEFVSKLQDLFEQYEAEILVEFDNTHTMILFVGDDRNIPIGTCLNENVKIIKDES